MRRIAALVLFAAGDLALAALDPAVALLPALVSFLGAAYVLVRTAEPAALRE